MENNGLMRPILFLISDWQYRGFARQASLLAPALPRERFYLHVYSLNGTGPLAHELKSARLEMLGGRGRLPFDLDNLFALRRWLKREQPALIHVWGGEALKALGRLAALLGPELPPLVISLSAAELANASSGWLNRRRNKNLQHFVVGGEHERNAFVKAGLAEAQIHVIRPAINLPASPPPGFRESNGIQPTDCLFMSIGHFEAPDRFMDALWAFEIVRGTEPSMRLMLIGDGRFRDRVVRRQYTPSKPGMGLHLLDARPDAASLLQHAEIVAISHRRGGGRHAVLEGMAAGRPVIAPRFPHLADLVEDEQTGCLVDPGDPVDWSRAARRLLLDRPLRERMGARARAVVEKEHRVPVMAERFTGLYEQVLHGKKVSP